MDFKAIRRTWRGVTYDSQLEADWCATFIAWGMDLEYHPGQIYLDKGGLYEPDFRIGEDIIFEVKGPSNDRIEKAWEASTWLKVVIGRSGYIPAGMDTEVAGAVWEPERWALENVGSKLRFVDTKEPREGLSWSAPYAEAHGLEGIRMFKAVGEDKIV